MAEYLVAGLAILACIVVGLTILGEAEPRVETRSLQPLHIAQMMDSAATGTGAGGKDGAWFCLDGELTACPRTEPLKEARLLARREACDALFPCEELSDDVLTRYRYFADDLEQLRAELAYSPQRLSQSLPYTRSCSTPSHHAEAARKPVLGALMLSSRRTAKSA